MELRYNVGMSSTGSGKKSPSQLPDLAIIQADTFAGIAWLRHGFSTRHGGVSEAYGGRALNLGITAEDTRQAVGQNRRLFFARLGAADEQGNPWPSVNMRQTHSSVIHRVEQLPASLIHGDGLITNHPGIVLSVRVADCLPVLLADPVHRAVGAFHAGWRGTLARIVEKGVGELRRCFATEPGEVKAAIGPAIHRCCYEVSEDLRDQFASQFPYVSELFEEVFDSDPVRRKYPLLFMSMRPPGHGDPPRSLHLDLVEANRRQLLDAGVREENIWISELCTSCRTDLLFSHRKQKGVTGRMIGAIGIKTLAQYSDAF